MSISLFNELFVKYSAMLCALAIIPTAESVNINKRVCNAMKPSGAGARRSLEFES